MEQIDIDILAEIERTKIIAVGVSEYDELKCLKGPSKDLQSIKNIFISTTGVSIYPADKISVLENPTTNELRELLMDYVNTRTAGGDILIFYFAGHGYISGYGEFSLCLKNSRKGFDDSGVLALSTLSFGEVVKSLSARDIKPCFILDTCFSAASAKVGQINVGVQIEYEASKSLGSSYAVLASSSPTAFSRESEEGGYFTQALLDTVNSGLPSNQNDPYVTFKNIPITLDQKLSSLGAPLSRLYIGHAFPEIAIAVNKNFNPNIRIERFNRSYKELLLYAWNEENPRCFTLDEIREDFPSGYGNHSKFEYIWGLLEDSQLPNGKKCRKLTEKGIAFIQGQIPIYREMKKNPKNVDEWIPTDKADEVMFNDL